MNRMFPRAVVYSFTAAAIVGVCYTGVRREMRMSDEVGANVASTPMISATVRPERADAAIIDSSTRKPAEQARTQQQRASSDLAAWEQKNGYTFIEDKSFSEGQFDYRWYVNRSGRPVVFQRLPDSANETSGIEWFADSMVVLTHQPQSEESLRSQLKETGVTAVSSL